MDTLHARLSAKLGAPVAMVISVDQDNFVLLDYFAAGRAHVWDNFFRLGPNDEVIWQSKTLRSGDLFTKISWDGVRLLAWTWEGYQLSIDPITGKVTDSVFTK